MLPRLTRFAWRERKGREVTRLGVPSGSSSSLARPQLQGDEGSAGRMGFSHLLFMKGIPRWRPCRKGREKY